MKIPIDFRQKAALPPAVNGAGYPYRLSADDLMRNFEYAALDVPEDQGEGLQLVITEKNGRRTIAADNSTAGTGSLIFVDCDGATVAQIDWVGGIISTTGYQTVEAGCTVVSSSAP